MVSIILLIILLMVSVRGFYLNAMRKRIYKKFMEHIVEPMRYIVKLQDDGFFRALYFFSKQDTYIDGTYRGMLENREKIAEDYDDTNTWRCFFNPKLEKIQMAYDELREPSKAFFNAVFERQKIMVKDMMNNGCHNYQEYIEYLKK